MFGSKGQIYERHTDLLSLEQFVDEGGLEFSICNTVINFLLTLHRGFFFLNLNQSFVSCDGIFNECKHIKINIHGFAYFLGFSSSKLQISVVFVLVAGSV